jgi:hypothetical protein
MGRLLRSFYRQVVPLSCPIPPIRPCSLCLRCSPPSLPRLGRPVRAQDRGFQSLERRPRPPCLPSASERSQPRTSFAASPPRAPPHSTLSAAVRHCGRRRERGVGRLSEFDFDSYRLQFVVGEPHVPCRTARQQRRQRRQRRQPWGFRRRRDAAAAAAASGGARRRDAVAERDAAGLDAAGPAGETAHARAHMAGALPPLRVPNSSWFRSCTPVCAPDSSVGGWPFRVRLD